MINNTMITAHSGCDKTAQNSVNYLQHAMMMPFDCIEVDVRRAPDNSLLLSHNPELQGFEPRLEVAFKLLSNFNTSINCDLKEYNLEDDIIKIAVENNIDLNRIIFTGSITDPATFNNKYVNTRVFVNPEELITDFYKNVTKDSMIDLVNQTVKFGFNVLNVNYQICNDFFIKLCNDNYIKLSCWTVDDEDIFNSLIDQNVLNITTNHSEFMKNNTGLDFTSDL